MKILNVTPYNISNYGAMLQAWALRYVLEGMGHQVVYLHYPRIWPGRFKGLRLLQSRSIGSLRSKLAINKQLDMVEKEIGGWEETMPYCSIESLIKDPPLADCYLVGSDQVFGVDRLVRFEKSCHAVLAFGSADVPRIAYAASFGRPVWSNEEIKRARWAISYLKCFRAIGLREMSGIGILKEWAGIDGVWTPDPTLLLDAEDYRRQFDIRVLSKSRPRVVTYMLGFLTAQQRVHLYKEACSSVATYLNGSVDFVELKPMQSLSYWLTEIANADYVITNSFHGICFSLIFNRPFLPLGFDGEEAWRNARAYDYLEHVGISDRYRTANEYATVESALIQDLKWSEINVCLQNFRRVGRDFLASSLCDV